MLSLNASFAAGSLSWSRLGPSRHAPHWRDRIKLYVLLGGTTLRRRAVAGLPWHPVGARSFGVSTGGTCGEVEFLREGQFFALELDWEFVRKEWGRTPVAARPADDVHGARGPFLHHLASEAVGVLRREGALSAGYVESVARLTSVHLRRRYLRGPVLTREERSHTTLTERATRQVLAHIHANLGTALPLDELAAAAGLSRFYFARALRLTVGETPHRYVMRRRVERARQLLLGDTRISLAEAAFQTGFRSQSHFTRCFREMCGQTPGELLAQGAARNGKDVQDGGPRRV